MIALIVTHLPEVHRPPLQVAKLVTEVTVHRTRVDHRHARGPQGLLVVRLGFVEEVHAQRNRDARIVDHAFHPLGVAVRGQTLPRVLEIAVVVVEAHRQTLDDRRGQLGRIGLPLLARVVLDERLVQGTADELDALVVEVPRIGAGQLARLLCDKLLRLGRRVTRVEELIDGAQVDRQRIHLAVMRGIHPVHVVGERRETIHVIPHTPVGRVEQVRPVLVDLRARLLIEVRVGVAADVVAHVDDMHTGTRMLHRLLRHRQTKQPSTHNNQIRILHGISTRVCHASRSFQYEASRYDVRITTILSSRP